jgi:hypothetical protein
MTPAYTCRYSPARDVLIDVLIDQGISSAVDRKPSFELARGLRCARTIRNSQGDRGHHDHRLSR